MPVYMITLMPSTSVPLCGGAHTSDQTGFWLKDLCLIWSFICVVVLTSFLHYKFAVYAFGISEMVRKGLAMKKNKKAHGSVTQRATRGKNKSKDAFVDNELVKETQKDESMEEAVVGMSKGQESAEENSSKSKDVALDNDQKMGAQKNEVMEQASGNKPEGDKSVAKQVRESHHVIVDGKPTFKNLRIKVRGKGAGHTFEGEKPVTKPSSKLKGIDIDDTPKKEALKDEVRSQVSDDKFVEEKSAAKKGKAAIGANVVKENSKEETLIPFKRKRGADEQMAQAFLLSPQRISSRLRPRKEMPAFRLVDLSDDDNGRIIGKRVKVYWSGSRKWFTGCIKAFDDRTRLHNIFYEDGDCELLDLRKERFELEIMPTENFRLRTKPNAENKVKGLDGNEVGAETLKDHVEMMDAEKVAMQLEPEKKSSSERSVKEGKDPEVNNEEKQLEEIGLYVLPDKADKVVIPETHELEEPPDASYEKEQTEHKMGEEAIQVSKESNSEVKKWSPDNVEGRRKKAVSFRICYSKSSKRRLSSRKGATPGAVEKNESKVKEDLYANVEANYQENEENTDSVAKEASEKGFGMSAAMQLNKKKEDDQVENKIEIEDKTVSADATKCMEVITENAEASVLPYKVEEKLRNRNVNVEGPVDFETVKNYNKIEILLKAASEASGDLQPQLPKAQEDDAEVLQGGPKTNNQG